MLDALEQLLDRLRAHARVGVGDRAELVVGVLEEVRVDRADAQPARLDVRRAARRSRRPRPRGSGARPRRRCRSGGAPRPRRRASRRRRAAGRAGGRRRSACRSRRSPRTGSRSRATRGAARRRDVDAAPLRARARCRSSSAGSARRTSGRGSARRWRRRRRPSARRHRPAEATAASRSSASEPSSPSRRAPAPARCRARSPRPARRAPARPAQVGGQLAQQLVARAAADHVDAARPSRPLTASSRSSVQRYLQASETRMLRTVAPAPSGAAWPLRAQAAAMRRRHVAGRAGTRRRRGRTAERPVPPPSRAACSSS